MGLEGTHSTNICYAVIVQLQLWDRGYEQREDGVPILQNPTMKANIIPLLEEFEIDVDIESTFIMKDDRNSVFCVTE